MQCCNTCNVDVLCTLVKLRHVPEEQVHGKKRQKTKLYEKIKNIEEEKNKQTKYMCKVYMYLGQK